MAQKQKNYKLWGEVKEHPLGLVKKILITAKAAGVELEIPQITLGESNTSEEFKREKNALGKVPVLETPEGFAIFESNAIAKYIAGLDKKGVLAGRNAVERAQIDSWSDFAINEIDSAAMTWLGPVLALTDYNEASHNFANKRLKDAFAAINLHLERRTYLVGERFTVADIIVASSLLPLFQRVLEPRWRTPFTNVARWFETITQKESFHDVWALEVNSWCVVAQKPQKRKGAPAAAAKKEDKKDEKKEEKGKGKAEKKPEAKAAKKAEKPADEDAEEDEAPKAPKNPLEALPKSPFNLEEYKREVSNKSLDEAIEYLKKNYDPETYTSFYADYKYNDELGKTFQSSNLIGGFYQRMEHMRKFAYGVMGVYGVNDANVIRGFWIVRHLNKGELPSPMTQVDDVEHYNWTRIEDLNKEADRLKAFINGDAIDGQENAEWKCFK